MMTRVFAASMLALLLGAGWVRVQHLDQPLLSFHATRQYRSAVIARACYYDRQPDLPEWARDTAKANLSMQPVGEPPLIEWLACAAYQWLGEERLMIPRLLSVTFWLLGAIPLYLLALRVASPAAAMIGTSTFLFLPYGIVASRAFQPDPLMTSCALSATWALARFYERQDAMRLAVAASAVAVAALVKPMSVFFTIAAAAGFAVAHVGLVSALWTPRLLMPVLLGLVPALLYYGYEAVFGTLARDQMRLRFVPSLLLSGFFWQGLWTQAQRVFGPPAFVAMVLGTVLAPPGLARALFVALWAGYAAFATAFTYHMPTHDYYHLPYLALAALAVAVLWDRVTNVAPGHESAVRSRSADAAAIAMATVIALWGTWSAMPRLAAGERSRIALYEEIGEVAEHTTRALFLDAEYGFPVMYHGQVSGDWWPTNGDLTAESLGGADPIDAATRFQRSYAAYRPTHFVVTDLDSFAVQPDLQRLLARDAIPLRQSATYHVYRFRDAR